MTYVRYIVALTALLSVSAGHAWADDWTMGGFDASLAHRTGERSGGSFPKLGWSYAIPSGASIVASPAVADGVIVVGAADGNVYALSATRGQVLWRFTTGDGIQATPAVLDGRVFVSSLDGKLYALHLANGKVAWQKTLGGIGQGSPVVVAGSLLVARGFPGTTLLRLDAHSGTTLWETAATTLAPFSNSTAASDGKHLVIGANEGHYTAFDMATGKKLWSYEAGGIVNLSTPLLVNGRAYFLPGGDSGRLHAVDVVTGAAIPGWPINLPAPVPDISGTALSRQFAVSSVAATSGGLIVDYRVDDALDTDNDAVADQFLMRETVAAVDIATGSVTWQQANGRQVSASFNDFPKYWLCPTPTVYGRTADSTAAPLVLAASTLTGTVRAFDTASGAVLGSIAAGKPSRASAILANGQAFLAVEGGTLQSWPSAANSPPAAPVLSDGAARTVNDVAPVIRWSSSMDPEGQAVTYQARLDSDGEVLESWTYASSGTSSDTTWHVPGNLDVTKSYVVAVRARDSQGAWSDWSSSQTLTVVATPPVSLGGTPQASLAAALLAAHPGDVVHVGVGTMRLGETVRVPAGVTMEGAGPQRTILDATGRDTGISLDGSAAGQPTQVSDLTVTGAGTGVSVGSVHDARLTNIIVRDSSDAGINVGAAGIASLRNGTLVANGRGAISFGMMLVKNSLVMNNQTGLVADHADALISQFNDVNGNTVADYQGLKAAPTDLSALVSFIDFAGRDLHLLARQPSTDRGDPTDDASAEPAPNGGRINLGAFGGTSEAELSAAPVDGTPDGGATDGGMSDAGTPIVGTADGGTPDATPTFPPPTSPTPASPPPAAPPPAASQPYSGTGTSAAGGGCDVAGDATPSIRLTGTLAFLALALLTLRRGRARSMARVPATRRHNSRPRRCWLLIGALLLGAAWSAPVQAATRGQTCVGSNNSSAATSVSCTWSGATTAGNTLLAFLVECNNGYVTPTTDGSGWSLGNPQPSSGNLRIRGFYNIGASSRSGTITWNLSGASNATLLIVEYSGISAVDLSNSSTGTSSTANTGATGTLAQAVEVVVGVVAAQGSGNTFSGETMTEVAEKNATDSTFGMDSAFLESITSATTSVSSNGTISGGSANWAGAIMSFKASAGGGGTSGLWVGAQSGHLWSNTANWSNGALPLTTDTVLLNSTGNNAMVIDTDATVAGFNVASGYTNSITQSGTRNLTITGDLTLAAASGTFTAPSGLMQIQGAFNQTGAITFTHNSGTVLLTSTSSKTLATNGSTFNNLIINDGLIGYWKLDESSIGTAADSSGYFNSATAHNSPTASTTVPTLGFRDPYSAAFTGVNGNNNTTPYFATGTIPSTLQPSIVTMSAWYRATGVASQGSEVISGSNRYSLRVYNSTTIKVTKQWGSSSWTELSATVTTPLDGNWHHIAGVLNGSGMIAYFDGVQVASNTDTNAIFYGTSVNNAVNGGAVGYFNIGRNQDTANYEFSGNIDEARLYNRTLSATEINSLAKGRQPGTGLATQTMTGAPTIAGDLIIASGTLAAGSNNITVSGNWWDYGGNYTSSANTVTLNGSGTNYLLSGGQTFSHLIFSGSGSITLADRFETDPGSVVDITGAGTFNLSSYTMRTGDINRNGATTITPGTGRVVFDANAARTFDTGTYNNLNIEPVTATELVGYWKMDDGQGTTVSDYSGNGNDGALTNNGLVWLTTGLPTAISFENPSALTLSGSSNPYVTTSGTLPTALKPSVITVSAWYKATGVDTSGAEVVSGSNNYAIRVFSSTQIKVAKQTAASTWVELTATVTNPLDGNWHHLAGVISGSGMYAYFDGALAGSNSDTTAIYYTGTTGMNFGRNLATTGYQFTGSIDDVRVYNTALSATQIAALASGTYPAGLSNVPAYALGYNSTVSGAFTQDGGSLDTSSYTMNVSSTGSAAAVNSGTYTLGSAANTFSGGLTVGGNATLGMASSGGSLQVGSTKTLTINGTFNASSTGATIQTAGGASTYYTFNVGSTATATPTLNITGLAVKNTDTNGMNINSNHSATTTFTRFDNIAFSGGTGTQLLQIYAPTLYLVSNGCTFDSGVTATTTYDVTLTGNGSATETRALFGGATCASNKTSCEAYDNDDDANTDGVGDNAATNAAVVQWVTAAESDTDGTIEGFPAAAFDWKYFTYYATYVLFHDVTSGTADRIYVRDASGNAKYYWDGPTGTDLIGTPRFDTDLTTDVHYVYVATASGKIYRLIDNGTSLAPDTTGNWASTNNPYDCSCTVTTPLTLDSTNLYWGGILTSGSVNKVFTLGKTSRAQVSGSPLTTTALVSGAAPALWASGDTYLFTGESTHFDKLDVTTQALTTTNASPTGTVNGRISIINSKLYGADTAGKLWVLDPSATGLTTKWSYHDDTNHNGCTSGVCAVTGSLYVDYLLNRAFYGDSDGHLYASYNSAGTTGAQMTGFPVRPNTSDAYATAPFYNAGILVAGTTIGNVYIYDINGGSGPVLLQTYKLGTTMKVSGVGYDKTGGNYLISAADPTLKNGSVYYIAAVTDPTPGSN